MDETELNAPFAASPHVPEPHPRHLLSITRFLWVDPNSGAMGVKVSGVMLG
jgi:hypothetical protein